MDVESRRPPVAGAAPGRAGGPRRGCFGCLTTTSMGCLAFVGGALGAIALFAPSLLGGLAKRHYVSLFNESYAGSVRLERLELSWRRPVRLLGVVIDDPHRRRVLAANVTLPSLLDMVDRDTASWDVRVDLSTMQLVVGADGRTNLEAALAPASGTENQYVNVWIGAYDSRRGFEQRFEYAIEVSGDGLRVVDEQDALLATVESFSAVLGRAPGQDVSLAVNASLAAGSAGAEGAERGAIWVEAGSSRPGTGGPRPWSASGGVRALPSVLADRRLGAGGRLAEALGATLDAHWSVKPGGPRSAAVDVDLEGTSGAILSLAGELVEGRLRGEGKGAWSLPVPQVWRDALTAGRLPSSLALAPLARETWQVEARDVSLDLGARGIGATGAASLTADLGIRAGQESFELAFDGTTDGEGSLRLSGDQLELAGRLADGAFVGTDDDRILIALSLDDSAEVDLLRALLPWCESFRLPAGGRPLRLDVRDFHLPLDGDVADARARIDLAEGDAELVPRSAFRGFLTGHAPDGPDALPVGLAQLDFDRELVTYRELELYVGDDFYAFVGTYDLRRDVLFLKGADVPMGFVHTDVPAKARGFPIAVTVSGTRDAISVAVDLSTLDEVTQGVGAFIERFRGGDN